MKDTLLDTGDFFKFKPEKQACINMNYNSDII